MTPDFHLLRSQLQRSRQHADELRQTLFLVQERRRRIEAEQARLGHAFSEGAAGARAENQRLLNLHAETTQQIQELSGRTARVQRELLAGLEAFQQVSDPRQQVERLDDAYPILLLPLRMETRFKQIVGPTGTQHQLWVRVYPDDCAIDTFEAALTEAEVRTARGYWAQVWRAGEDEALLRAAWQNLVGSHGSGRALWVVENYRPREGTVPPVREAGAVVLVIATSQPLDPVSAAFAATFWRAAWRAHDDAAGLHAARQVLAADVGLDQALRIVEGHRPFNLDDPPPAGTSRAGATVHVETITFDPDENIQARRHAWSRASSVGVLPDRLVLMAYSGDARVVEQLGNPIPSPLIVGPDPLAEKADQLRHDGDDVAVSAGMRWMFDFDEAVRVGMGFRVALTPAQYAAGFDRLLVLGVRLSADHSTGQRELEGLLRNHLHSRGGLSLLRQGTPTNNTDAGGAGFSSSSYAEASFQMLAGGGGQFEPATDWFRRADGQWLAEMLGIDPALLQRVQGAGHTDVLEAQAMNVALFPATAGYFMDTMMSPVFSEADVEFVRQFFTRFVSGRGMLSAVRIGQQPYGILPATVYSRMRWTPEREAATHGQSGLFQQQVTKLHEVLMRAREAWADAGRRVSRVGMPGDPHQILLDILGLHANSAEFDYRYAESLQQVINNLNLQGWLDRLLQGLRLSGQGVDVLRDHGYDPAAHGRPDLLDKYFLAKPDPVDAANLIHDRPLSESEGIRPYTTDGRDYIAWLVEAARTSFERLRGQQGFAEKPTALLYLMLSHSLMLGYYDAGVRLNSRVAEMAADELRQVRREPPFIHVARGRRTSESRFRLLYDRSASIAGTATQLSVADFITSVLGSSDDAARLDEQIAALERLRGLPTARLERVFVEHLDTCGYRLDAWIQGLVHFQLAVMRWSGEQAGARQGLYVGAFGWLEDVRRSERKLEPVALTDADLRDAFEREGDGPLMSDSANAGYVHAPSLNHAVTAAVLRNGYHRRATPGNPGIFAVNLSSERVRRAMTVVEGIRNGQSLGALLGYQFERGLHDRHDEAEVDQFIFKLRKAFPLVADRMRETARAVDDGAIDTDEAIASIEARNVLDGVALVEHIHETGNRAYPFGKRWLPEGTDTQRAVIDAEVERLLDTHDAIADLGLAEGIHQVVQGNFDRAAASVDAFAGTGLPPIPDVVQTPRSGTGLTHRVGLHLRPGLAPTASPVALDVTPRAGAEPALNHWLAGLLPEPDQVGVLVELSDGSGPTSRRVVTQADLGLQPIDLLYLLNAEGDQAMTALDDRIVLHAVAGTRPDTRVRIRYTERIEPRLSFFEAGALAGELRPLLLGARPLRATDVALPNEADPARGPPPEYRPLRLMHVRDRLRAPDGPLEAMRALVSELAPLMHDVEANRADLLARVDDRLGRFVAAAAQLSTFGLPHTGYGYAMEWKRERYAALLSRIAELVARWQARLGVFDEMIAVYDALPAGVGDEARFSMLAEAEAQVAVVPTPPLPATPAAYRAGLDVRRSAFTAKRDEFGALLETTTPNLATLLADAETAGADLELFELTPLRLDEDAGHIVRFCGDLLVHARNIVTDVDPRIVNAEHRLAEYETSTSAAGREAAFTAAAHTLLGEDFLVVPEFRLAGAQAQELQNAFDARASLLHHLTTARGVDFPVDDWLYGVARVRAPMQRWEAVTMFAEAVTGRDLGLVPTQLPHRVGDSWLAMQYPSDLPTDTDTLLYTVHLDVPFDGNAPQCGLLLDEWTEVVPAVQETTGVCFHYDRPNAEPPQTMLLATPPQLKGRWEWVDLVDTLRETLDLAKHRAVEPDHLADTDYARFLPATLSAATFSPVTIALNYAVANQVYAFVDRGNDG
jgi:hypothetical protein